MVNKQKKNNNTQRIIEPSESITEKTEIIDNNKNSDDAKIKQIVKKLNFEENNSIFTKTFNEGDKNEFLLQVDFSKQKLIYPEDEGFKINERQTCNFSAIENFVVFECVHRLFEKGYQPQHIELEPKWKLGHGASGGRADIWVKDNDGNSLLIIECKTAGKEFENAWKDMQEDGGQLFSYFQQEKSTQFVALYASNFIDNEIKYDYKLIAVRDNDEYLKTFGKKQVPNFKDSTTVKEIYRAWVETYQKDFSTKGLFEEDIAAYEIGKNKYSINDLVEVDSSAIQKKYHEFATILRQHNVSGHENAFDKLVNLFLAKIVDETNNKKELAFYWKGAAYDDVFSLIDRLQKYYKIGMQQFLNEDVTYIEKSQIDDAFKFFKNKPEATKEKILEYFNQLKYYTNNDFAFIDVHNEKLFYQNAEVLLKIVKMLQDMRLQTETQNQFLGDLFEGFLDKGVKQSEGQFFTPTPIVKFLISSLPLKTIINDNVEIPKVIDYACGAGHFLNEYAHQILPFIAQDKKADFYKHITGIEKEYRLSKVAKVSAFMYGQDQIKIMYADALAKTDKLKDGSFSVLVANPPYSVKGFLETLDDDSRAKFELFDGNLNIQSNNSIECFFVERAKQLLCGGGVAAIILPSSILNNGNIYIKMREILLKYFDIVAIAEFGKGTFGKTSTNTATLFLRRKDSNPDIATHYKNCVDTWFSGDFETNKQYKIPPETSLADYCKKVNFNLDDYKTLLAGSPNDNLLATDIFKEYIKAFTESAEYKNIQKRKLTAKYTEEDRQTEIEKAKLKFLQGIENEKLYYFLLAENNPQNVVIVKSPADNKAIKNFLGYEWSSAKGNEGIKYMGVNASDEDDAILQNKGINQIKTPLFNPNNLDDTTKINSIIRDNFSVELRRALPLPGDLQPFVSFARLTDMLDFSQVSFNKAIKTMPENQIEIDSKYELKKLVEILDFQGKGKRPAAFKDNNGTIPFITSSLNEEKCNVADENMEALIIGDGGTANVHYVNGEFSASDHTYILKNKTQKQAEIYFIYYFLSNNLEILESGFRGSDIKNISKNYMENIKIPLPPLDIQQQIVAECAEVDEEYNTSRMTVEEYKKKIADVFERGGG